MPSRSLLRPLSVALTVLTLTVLTLAACGSSAAKPAAEPSDTSTATPPNTPATKRVSTFPPAPTVDPTVGVSTAPVTPLVAPVVSSFEGHTVLSWVPAHPTGIIYLFHGSGGSADFATKVETTDVLNGFVRQGYGYVATESTDRTARQWDVTDPDVTANPDLARMLRLHDHVIASTGVTASTPVYGIGMSNGSAFAALWAEACTDHGVPVAAVALYMAGPTRAVATLGGLSVPTFMVIGQHDTVTRPAKERRDLAAIAARRVPTELHEVVARPVTAARFLRIPGVDRATADAIVLAYRTAGLIDSAGMLTVDPATLGSVEDQRSLAGRVALPVGLTAAQRTDVNNELKATIGQHQFNAEFAPQNRAFFEAHR